MKQRIVLFWQSRNAREQKILLAWAMIMALILLYSAVISPLQTRITRLQHSIPALESQLFAMRAQPPQAMRPASANAHSGSDLRTSLFQLIGAQKRSIDLRSISAERVELRLPALPVDEALLLADNLRRDAQARIAMLAIQNDGKDNTVRLVLEMERNP